MAHASWDTGREVLKNECDTLNPANKGSLTKWFFLNTFEGMALTSYT